MNTIFNNYLSISAKSQGAELTSIRGTDNNIEYLWQADPAVWPRHAPVLFPIVGKMGNKYVIDGQEYELSQHGFARDMDFVLIEKTVNKLTYALGYNDVTLQKYPYQFEFQVSYELDNNVLATRYTIINKDSRTMHFSVGAHPAFNCPLLPDEIFEDYFLEFEKEESVHKYLLENGLLSGKTAPLLNNERILPVNTDLFKEDALVLKTLQSQHITLRSSKSSHYVKMVFKNFPFFGIWTKPDTEKFICLEPWMGIADTKAAPKPFHEKEGILSLAEGKTFQCEFSLIFE